jgi:Zn finger protein HypA/HybF involved in hydrogenase expression
MSALISDALKSLLQESYLYRNKHIDIIPAVEAAEEGVDAERVKRTLERRPWLPVSHNQGFTAGEIRTMAAASAGIQPIGTPLEELKLSFEIPTIHTWCPKCKAITLHDSIPHLDCSPYHLNPEAIAEPLGVQNFLFNMQCQQCKSPPTTFMVRREFLKIQLTGRSHPFIPKPPDEIPDSLKKIFVDATGAASCGDTFGAFYHLRTLMEHHMKSELGIATDTKLEGDALCERYNKAIDLTVAERCSLTEAFATCAKNLHNRTGEIEDYEKIRDAIITHFKLKQTLQRLPRKAP